MASSSLRGATSVGEISVDTIMAPGDTLMPVKPYQLRESTLTVNYPDCGGMDNLQILSVFLSILVRAAINF